MGLFLHLFGLKLTHRLLSQEGGDFVLLLHSERLHSFELEVVLGGSVIFGLVMFFLLVLFSKLLIGPYPLS